MTLAQLSLAILLLALLALFIWGRYRHDVVSMAGLLVAVLLGLVPADGAFAGFAHPATITVAFVLILGRGLADSGAVDLMIAPIMRFTRTVSLHVLALCAVGAALSGFMNNVGALALLMPVAMETAAKTKRSPALLLMPLAFATVLGGTMTLIGTPPNLIVAGFRNSALGSPYTMFDFAPVGVPITVAGVLLISFLGWRLVPKARRRAASSVEFFELSDYVVELRLTPESKLVGLRFGEAVREVGALEATVLSVVRGSSRYNLPPRWLELEAGDLLLLEASPETVERLRSTLQLELAEEEEPPALGGDDVRLVEMVVRPGSFSDGRSIASLDLAARFNVNLLGVARQGGRVRTRLGRLVLRGGDVLLLRGQSERLPEVIRLLGGLPLAERRLPVGRSRWALPALALFIAAIALATSGLVPTAAALALGVLGFTLLGIVPPRELYNAIDWSVVVLLGALIPVGGAIETTGLAGVIAEAIAGYGGGLPSWAIVAILMMITMTVSDLLNNAATVLIMTPIALEIAVPLDLAPDVVLMTVAVGASCSFLTPIGHQNSTLVMAPGGYVFGDYWRMGLPLEILIVLIGTPLLLLVWGGAAG
jgi:di/tricarboxylate transporter